MYIDKNAALHFYSDEVQKLEFLQSASDVVQSHLTQIKLALNSDKFKFKWRRHFLRTKPVKGLKIKNSHIL